MKLFSYDNPVMQFMSRVADFMLLNFLWLVCSLPIVTFGASTSAYYYCMMKIVRDTDSGILKMFFHSFKENLKQGIVLTIILIVTIAFLGADMWACSQLEGQFFDVIGILLYAFVGLLAVVVVYVFPVLAQFDNTIKNTIKNAFFMGISHIGKTLLLIVITALPFAFAIFLPYYFLMSLPVWLFGGVSVVIYYKTRLFVKIFDKYMES